MIRVLLKLKLKYMNITDNLKTKLPAVIVLTFAVIITLLFTLRASAETEADATIEVNATAETTNTVDQDCTGPDGTKESDEACANAETETRDNAAGEQSGDPRKDEGLDEDSDDDGRAELSLPGVSDAPYDIKASAVGGAGGSGKVKFSDFTLAVSGNTEQKAAAEARSSLLSKLEKIETKVEADAETGERTLTGLTIEASALTGVTAEDRVALDALEEDVPEGTPEAVVLEATASVLADSNIKSIKIDEKQIAVTYLSTIRLFGLFPIKHEVVGSVNVQGETTIDYPWYGVISSKPDKDTIEGLLDGMAKKVAKFKAGKALADTVK